MPPRCTLHRSGPGRIEREGRSGERERESREKREMREKRGDLCPHAVLYTVRPRSNRERETERQRDRETERQRDRERQRETEREEEEGGRDRVWAPVGGVGVEGEDEDLLPAPRRLDGRPGPLREPHEACQLHGDLRNGVIGTIK